MDAATVFAINGVTVDLANELLLDRSGNAIVLRPQPLAVLRYLIERANRLVTKEELMAAAWPDTAVTDDSLVQCIHQIRRALNDDAHVLLKTVPKRGYRLALPADVGIGLSAVPATRSAAIPGRSRMASVAIGLLVLAVTVAASWRPSVGPLTVDAAPGAAAPSLAVLPFDTMSDDPQQGYFAAGITEDLITDLSRLSGIFVVAKNAAAGYMDKTAAAKRAAEELGVRYVLQGSVRRESDRVRINAQLIDTASDHPLWADRYDGTLGDGFSLQDRVVANVVSALTTKLRNDRTEAEAVETNSSEAYDALVLGLAYLRLNSEEDTRKALSLFDKAVTLDRNYGRAHAAIAAAQLSNLVSDWYTTSEAGPDVAQTSLRLHLDRAMERPTPLAYTVAARWALQLGRRNEAIALIEKARALAPSDREVLVSRALLLNATGRATEAEAELRLAMRVDPSFAPATLRVLAAAQLHQRKYREAVDTVERIDAQGVATMSDYITLASGLGQLGRQDAVKDAIRRYDALAIRTGRDPMSVQEAQWHWNGELLDYHRPYVDDLVEGLRKAGVPEGAGMDVPIDRYKALVTRDEGGAFRVRGAIEISPMVAGGLYDRKVRFIDVSAPAGYASGHIPGAVNLSAVSELSKEALGKVADPRDEIVFYCHNKNCESSAFAAAKALVWGYTQVYRMAGGIPDWREDNCPVEVASLR